jgi:hypothetical protein
MSSSINPAAAGSGYRRTISHFTVFVRRSLVRRWMSAEALAKEGSTI